MLHRINRKKAIQFTEQGVWIFCSNSKKNNRRDLKCLPNTKLEITRGYANYCLTIFIIFKLFYILNYPSIFLVICLILLFFFFLRTWKLNLWIINFKLWRNVENNELFCNLTFKQFLSELRLENCIRVKSYDLTSKYLL